MLLPLLREVSIITSTFKQQSWTEPLSKFEQKISWQLGKLLPPPRPALVLFSLSLLICLDRCKCPGAQQHSCTKSTEFNSYLKYREKIYNRDQCLFRSVICNAGHVCVWESNGKNLNFLFFSQIYFVLSCTSCKDSFYSFSVCSWLLQIFCILHPWLGEWPRNVSNEMYDRLLKSVFSQQHECILDVGG